MISFSNFIYGSFGSTNNTSSLSIITDPIAEPFGFRTYFFKVYATETIFEFFAPEK